MSDKIEEIRARYAGYSLNSGNAGKANEDRGWLLAEVDRLRADLATQQGCCDGAAAQDAHVRQELAEHKAEIEQQRAEIKRLRDALRWYADQRNHFPVEHRRPGDPDPAVVFVEEPPIMNDCGRRARAALEGKQ